MWRIFNEMLLEVFRSCEHCVVLLLQYQYCALFIIYNLTNDCAITSNTIITDIILLHVSTFKLSPSGSSLCLAKNLCVLLARHSELPEDDNLNVETCRITLFAIIVFDTIVQSLVKL